MDTDGVRYEGQIKKDDLQRNGFGIGVMEDGSIYEGQWKNNEKSGLGRTISKNGAVIEGEYKNGEPTGYCTMTQPDGSLYRCQFKRGIPSGRGYEVDKDGNVFVGEFDFGMKESKNDFVVRYHKGDWFQGLFKDNHIKNGKYIKANGQWYEGDFQRDEPLGEWNKK